MSLIQTPWARQPQQAVGIDWSNPITRGLVDVIDMTGKPRSVILGTPATTFGTAPSYSAATAKGLAVDTRSAFGGVYFSRSDGKYATAAQTHIAVAEFTAASAYYAGYFATATSDGATNSFSLQSTGGGSDALVYPGGTFATGAESALFNTGINVVGLSGSGTFNLYKNGKLVSSGSSTPASQSTSRLVVFGERSANSGYATKGRSVLHLFYNRHLSATEHAIIAENPWQIFKPIPRRIFVPVAAGGSDVTGTFSATEAAETLSAAGGIIVGGAASVTESAETVSASGSVAIGATSSITETAETLSASGTVDSGVVGTASISEAAETVSASGSIAVGGTASITNDAQTLTAAGSIQITGAGNLIELAETLTASGIVLGGITGSADLTLAAQTLSAFATSSFGTIARPGSDTSNTGWTPSTGSDLYAMIDEVTPNDADYISTTSAGSVCKLGLGAVADPGTSSGQVVSYRASSSTGNGLKVELMQGAAVIATWTHATLTSTDTTYQQSLSGAECDAITDYTALSVRLTSL